MEDLPRPSLAVRRLQRTVNMVLAGADEAQILLQNHETSFPRFGAVLTVGPVVPLILRDGSRPPCFTGAHLHADFDDIPSLDSRNPRAPQRKIVIDLIDTAARLYEDCVRSGTLLLVHGNSGASLCTATAISLLAQQFGNDFISTVVQCVRSLQPSAYPNERIITIADDHLDANGALIDAVDNLIWSRPQRAWMLH